MVASKSESNAVFLYLEMVGTIGTQEMVASKSESNTVFRFSVQLIFLNMKNFKLVEVFLF